MEDNKNRNYDQEDRDYKDAPATTDFEKSKLNDDPNQTYQKNPEQFEEFDGDQPNHDTNNGIIKNSGNTENQNWKNEDIDRNINGNSNSPHPISDPDDDFEDDIIQDDGNEESDLDYESDVDDEDLNDENDFDESDADNDGDDEINNENSDFGDEWANRKN